MFGVSKKKRCFKRIKSDIYNVTIFTLFRWHTQKKMFFAAYLNYLNELKQHNS